MATAGMILGIVGIVLSVLVIILWFAGALTGDINTY
jgi:hypothetical protein